MVSVVDAVGLLAIVFVNAAVAALMTRFFRVQLVTRWGSAVFVLFLVPLVQLVVVFVLSGLFALGPDLGSGGAVVGATILLPLTLGVAFDFFWMPAPEELDLPDRGRDRRSL